MMAYRMRSVVNYVVNLSDHTEVMNDVFVSEGVV